MPMRSVVWRLHRHWMPVWVLMAGCAQLQLPPPGGATASQNALAPAAPGSSPAALAKRASPSDKPTYYGLTRESYGQRVALRDRQTGNFLIRPCDPNHKYEDVNELSRTITEKIFGPVDDPNKADDTIKKLQLTEYFPVSSDPLFGPIVAIIDPRPNAITIWHESDLISLARVSNAASAFCKRSKLNAAYIGTATHCWTHRAPVVINHQTTESDTFAISEFQCQ